MQQMPVFALVTLIALGLSLMLIKPLNAMLLGDKYAENLGINTRRVRNYLLFLTADHGAVHNGNFLNSHKLPGG